MKAKFDDSVESCRMNLAAFETTKRGDRRGLFMVRRPGIQVTIIVDEGDRSGWEHVSVSVKINHPTLGIVDHTPSWDVMCQVKSMFWEPEECVLQFHPPASVYVNTKANVLHLWKRVGVNAETPPVDLV